MRFAFGVIALILSLAAPLKVQANAELYDSRMSDPLFRTGERFAIVVENHMKRNVQLKVHFDPSFFLASKMAMGLISVPSEAIGYKVFHRRMMGVPKFETERAESLPSEAHLKYSRGVFAELPGAKIDTEIRFSTSGPLNPECVNVFPHKNVPLATERVPLSYLNIDETDPTISVIYVTIPPKGDTCLAQYHVPGDMSWLDGGHPPEHMMPQPVPEPVLLTLTPMGHFIEALKNQALQFAGMPALVSGSGLVLNMADAASLYIE